MNVIVTRDINGISLNAGLGRDVLLDPTGEEMVFESKAKAIEFLKSVGMSDADIEFFRYEEAKNG
jgi:hypothetical protein